MAPVLQCPDCGTKHPLAVAAGAAAFRCSGCGRVLKVPEQFRAGGPEPEPATARLPATQPAPVPNGRAPARVPSRRMQRASEGVVPFWARLLLWIVAVPAGFVVVFGLARAAGLLTSKQLEDVFLETGWDRFWPVVRMLPFVAFVTAAIVHFSVLAISRWRCRRASTTLAGATGQLGTTAEQPAARPVS